MLAPMIAWLIVSPLATQAPQVTPAAKPPKPPKVKYDKVRDVTIYSTGDVRTAGYSGYGAQYEFPGKTPSLPKSIAMGFGSLRISDTDSPDQDQALLHWKGLKSISLTFGGQTQEYPAVQAYNVSKNEQVNDFLGRALEESMSITLTPEQFRALAAADSIKVQIGKDKQTIQGRSMVPLKRLAACLPPS